MKKLFTLVLTTFLVSQTFAQIAAWNTFSLAGGTNDFGPSPYAATTLDANLTSSGLVRGSGLSTTGTGAGKVWGGTSYAFTTLQNAIDSNKFVTFSITPNANYSVSLGYIDSIRVRISQSGPFGLAVQYAVGSNTYKTVKTYTITRPASGTSNYTLDTINLSGTPELQNVAAGTAITFRLVPYSSNSASGTFYIGNNATSYNSIAIFGTNAILPVTLKSISASLINNQPQVNWETSNETNFDYFGVEKSLDAKNFAEIARVASNKASNGSTYQYADINKTLATQFYRLKMVDNDGTFKYSSVVAVNAKPTISLALYPNPVTNTIILSHPKAIAGAAVKVTSIDGKILSTQNVQTGATQTSIDATRLVKGNYVVSFVNNGVSSTTQLVKQ